jgi:hypothetical protein
MTSLRAVRSEPAGATYLALLAFAERHSRTFSLAWRKQLRFDDSARRLEKALQPFLEVQRESDNWPGTTLIGHTAIVRFYRLDPDSSKVLARAGRLYAWLAPERPEDLAFYTAAGRWWFASVAHERDAFVESEAVDVAELTAAVPGLQL